MGKLRYILLVLVLITGLSVSVSALGTPEVVANQGKISGMVIQDGFYFGGELGLTDNVGVFGQLGDSYDRFGIKYEIDPNLAVVGGLMNSAFVGVNLSKDLTDEMKGIAELSITSVRDKMRLFYDLGVKYDLRENLDIRGGVIGVGSSTSIQIGFGYSFK